MRSSSSFRRTCTNFFRQFFYPERENSYSSVFTSEEYTRQFSLSDQNMALLVNGLFCSLLLLKITAIDCQFDYQSFMLKLDQGLQYFPVDSSIQLISSSLLPSFQVCVMACNNHPMCSIFDYGATLARECRLFEGNLGVMGSLIPSPLSDSRVGTVQPVSSLFVQHGQPCSSICRDMRYLFCNVNSTCECLPHFYWHATSGVCLPQLSVSGASCVKGMNMCRRDLNLTCSVLFNDCRCKSIPEGKISQSIICICLVSEPPFPLVGVTVVDNNTVIQGSVSNGLLVPLDLIVYNGSFGESLIVVNSGRNEVLHVQNVLSSNRNVSVLLKTWASSEGFDTPEHIALDRTNDNNLYVSDTCNDRVVLFPSMQAVNPIPRVVAGISRTNGSTLDRLFRPTGLALDNQSNLYVTDAYNFRVMFWAVNATSGILIAGTGISGDSSQQLGLPVGLFLNRQNTLLYVADAANHRIQLFRLNGTPPYDGITVAGGNGQGSNDNQLFAPCNVWVSERTGNMFIADTLNNRIQLWNQNATSGVTIAGDSDGAPDSNATRLAWPYGIVVNANETRMYVTDWNNQRIQLFDLV